MKIGKNTKIIIAVLAIGGLAVVALVKTGYGKKLKTKVVEMVGKKVTPTEGTLPEAEPTGNAPSESELPTVI
jgi:hypothetical protein